MIYFKLAFTFVVIAGVALAGLVLADDVKARRLANVCATLAMGGALATLAALIAWVWSW